MKRFAEFRALIGLDDHWVLFLGSYSMVSLLEVVGVGLVPLFFAAVIDPEGASRIPFIGRWSVLGVGVLAGFGVDTGYNEGPAVAGITAAGVTLVVVLITKFVILAAIFVPIAKKAVADASQTATTNVSRLWFAMRR